MILYICGMSSATSATENCLTAEGLLGMDAARAEEIFAQGKEAVVFALLTLAKRANETAFNNTADPSANPATPSAMIPPYQKPSAKSRKKKSGAKPGHAGSRRAKHRAGNKCRLLFCE